MAILQVKPPRITSILILMLIAVLSACGGGGSKKDTTPNSFSFTPVTGAATGAVVTSNSITVTGINKAASISVSGGQYSVNGSAYTSSAGTVTKNQTVKVQLTASSSTNTATSATLNIGGVSSTFTVTTLADVTPDSFTFAPEIDATPSEVYVSNSITVSGIDIAVPITITGGEYSVNGGAYTTSAGTVSAGHTVSVRATASDELETDVSVTVTVGGVTAIYTVTTMADTNAPTAEFLFPPKVSMTEGTALRVRGKIIDDFNAVASAQIQVNNNAATDLTLTTNDDGSANWDQVVTLGAGENTIRIIATDDVGNTTASGEEVFVSVRQDSSKGSFPDAANPMPFPRAMVIDRLNGRNRLLVTEGNAAKIFSVDLATGARTLFTDFPSLIIVGLTDMLLNENTNQIIVRDDASRITKIDLDNPGLLTQSDIISFGAPTLGGGFAFTFNDTDPDNLILMASHGQNGNLVEIALDLSSTEIFSDSTNADQGAPIPNDVRSMTFDKANQRYLVSSFEDQTIYAVESDGERKVFSSGGVGSGDDFAAPSMGGFLWSLAVDDVGQRVVVLERNSGKVFILDNEGNRTLLSSPTFPNAFNPLNRLSGLAVNSFDSYAFVTDELAVGIFAVDLVTGERVYFSKN